MRKLGVIAALEEEGAAFFPEEGLMDSHGPLPIRRLDKAGLEIVVLVPGIGKVNSAMAATHLILSEGCDALLVIGTAGLIGDRQERCFWLHSAVQHDYGAERSTGFVHYTAGSWPIGPAVVEAFLAMPDPGLGLPHARVASGDSFIECPDHARFLSEGLSADVVEMETAAVAQVARRFGVPWAGIRAISDDANGDSAGTFQANLDRAARQAGEAAERFVEIVTQGASATPVVG